MNKCFIIFLAFILSSCINYKDLEFKGISNLSFSRQDGCNPICVYIDIFNPNSFNIKLQSGSGKAEINSKALGNLKLKKRTKLKSNQTSTVQLKISSSGDQLLKTIFNSLEFILGKKVDFKLTGKIKAKVYGIPKSVSFNETRQISMQDLSK